MGPRRISDCGAVQGITTGGVNLSEGDARGGHGASLRDYLRVVRRRKWIILLAVLLVPAVAVGLSLRQEKVYKATSQVLLVQQNPADQFERDQPVRCSAARSASADAGGSRAGSRRSLKRLSASPGLNRPVDQFLGHSSAAAKTNSDLLELSVWDHQPQVAIDLAKAYAQAFAGYRADLDTAPYETAKARADTQLRAMVLDGGKGSAAYQELQAKRDQLDQYVALLTRNAVPVKLPDQAVQIQPKPVRNGILGLALGLVLGIGLAFLREALDTRVRSAEEVGEKLGLPLLARVPEPPRKLRNSNRLVMMADPHGVSGGGLPHAAHEHRVRQPGHTRAHDHDHERDPGRGQVDDGGQSRDRLRANGQASSARRSRSAPPVPGQVLRLRGSARPDPCRAGPLLDRGGNAARRLDARRRRRARRRAGRCQRARQRNERPREPGRSRST